MKTKFKGLCLAFVVMAAPLVAGADGFFAGPDTPLTRAHQAYLTGDFKNMALNLRQALEQKPTDSIVKENVLTLLRKAYEVPNAGQLVVDWRLPDEIKQMKVGVKRSLGDDIGYTFRVYGSTIHPKTIAQLQVVQFPDIVVLDKQAGLGSWNDNSGIDELSHDYELASKKTRQVIPGGLYFLNITLNDGNQTKGWFIMDDDINSTESPRVFTPNPDQVFSTGNPTFNWQDFKSPQYKNFEKRSLWVGVSRSEPPHYDWDEVWGHYEAPPSSEQIIIDSHGDEPSVSKLTKGRYVLFIDYHERRKFGDLDITRDSFTSRNFRVTQE